VDNTEQLDEVTILLVTDERPTVSPFMTFGQKTKLQPGCLGLLSFECNKKRPNLIAVLSYYSARPIYVHVPCYQLSCNMFAHPDNIILVAAKNSFQR
jgi:hypothetical protein